VDEAQRRLLYRRDLGARLIMQPRPNSRALLLNVEQRDAPVLLEMETSDIERDSLFDREGRASQPAIHTKDSIVLSARGGKQTHHEREDASACLFNMPDPIGYGDRAPSSLPIQKPRDDIHAARNLSPIGVSVYERPTTAGIALRRFGIPRAR
jgi:hypothetical protein